MPISITPTIVGLGRMGANMARRLTSGGISVHGFEPSPDARAALMARFSSRGKADTGNKLLSLMRKGFGGHATVAKD